MPEDIYRVDFALPSEILSFMECGETVSLLIKGRNGSGKTTLSLQLLEHVGGDRYYISTRGNNSYYYPYFSWLKKADDALIIAKLDWEKMERLRKLKGEGSEIRGARELLHEMVYGMKASAKPPQLNIESDDKKEIHYLLSARKRGEDALHVYRMLKKNPPRNGRMIINRIDTLAELLNIDVRKLVKVLKKDIQDEMGITMIYIAEKSPPIEEFVSGVITIKDFSTGAKEASQIEINKLEHVNIQQPRYIFNIINGKLNILRGVGVVR